MAPALVSMFFSVARDAILEEGKDGKRHGKWEMDTGSIQGWRNGPIVRQGEILGCDSL